MPARRSEATWATRILRAILWACLLISLAGVPLTIMKESDERARRASNREDTQENVRSDFIWEMSWRVNYWSGFPTCFVLSAGFLCLSYSIESFRHSAPRDETPLEPGASA
jgi:bacteriorhodopsin